MENWAALGLDIGCLILPFVSGGSTVYRVADEVDNIDDIHDAINGLEIAGDMSDIALVGRNADRVKGVGKLGYTYYDGLQSYGKLASKGWYGKVIADIGRRVGMAMSSSYRLERLILTLYRGRKYIRWGIRIGLEF